MPEYAWSSTAVDWLPLDGAPALPSLSRDDLVWGTYLPGPDTTGLADASLLTTVTGTQTYTSVNDGQVIENKNFTGYVNINGVVNLTFRNCQFNAPSSRTDRPTVLARTARNANNLFEDCAFRNTYADPFVQNGWMGRGTTLRRCDISGGVDGVGVAPAGTSDRADVVLEATWIHDLLYVRPYSGQSDNQTHSDGIQWHGGPGLQILGCRIEGFMDTSLSSASWSSSDFYPGKQTTSALMVNSSDSFLPTGELRVEKSWVNGGGVGINMVGVPTRFLTDDGSKIIDNHFGYDFGFGSSSAIYCKSNHVFQLTGNKRWVAADPLDSSIDFNVRTHG